MAKTVKLWLLGFRKAILTLVYLVVATSLLVTGYLPADNWLGNVTTVLVTFLGTNVSEHILQAIKAHWAARGGK